jgi:hypothetical protein
MCGIPGWKGAWSVTAAEVVVAPDAVTTEAAVVVPRYVVRPGTEVSMLCVESEEAAVGLTTRSRAGR